MFSNDVIVSELISLNKTWSVFLHNCVVRTYFDSENDTIVLEQIYVPAKQRRKGYGDAIMDELTTLADGFNKTVTLSPDDCFGVPVQTLAKFYGSHGFSWVYPEMTKMCRLPQ